MAKSTGPKEKYFRLNQFLGGMVSKSEINALNTVDPASYLPAGYIQIKTEFINIDNFWPLYRGGLSKTPGHVLYFNSGTTTPITGIHHYVKSDGTSLLLYTQGVNWKKTTTGTPIYSSISNGAYTHQITALNSVIMCDGVAEAQTYDGTTVAELGGDLTGARQTLFYQNRLWLFRTNSSLLYYSDAGTLDTNISTNFINCDTNDGQYITSIAKFFIPGNLEPTIVVGKSGGIGIITGTGGASDPYTFKKIANDVGIPGFRQIQQFGNDVAFLTPQGPNSYKTAVANVNMQRNFLSSNIQDQFLGLNPSTLPNALCWFDTKANILSFAVPSGTSVYPNQIWHYDPINGGWYKQTGFNITSVLADTDGIIYIGGSDGLIYKRDAANYAYNYNGSPIVANAKTGYMDFFDAEHYKEIVEAEIVYRVKGEYPVSLSTSLDFGQATGSSHTFDNTGLTVTTWGGGLWSSDASVYQWGNVPVRRKKFFPKGIFKNIAFNFSQSGTTDLTGYKWNEDTLDLTKGQWTSSSSTWQWGGTSANQSVDILEMTLKIRYLNLT